MHKVFSLKQLLPQPSLIIFKWSLINFKIDICCQRTLGLVFIQVMNYLRDFPKADTTWPCRCLNSFMHLTSSGVKYMGLWSGDSGELSCLAQNCHLQMDRETRDRHHLGMEWIWNKIGIVRTQDGEDKNISQHLIEGIFWVPQKGPYSGY